jgi:hypothetical protein
VLRRKFLSFLTLAPLAAAAARFLPSALAQPPVPKTTGYRTYIMANNAIFYTEPATLGEYDNHFHESFIDIPEVKQVDDVPHAWTKYNFRWQECVSYRPGGRVNLEETHASS